MKSFYILLLLLFLVSTSFAEEMKDTDSIFSSCLDLRGEITGSLKIIDDMAASASIHLTHSPVSDTDSLSLLTSLSEANPAVFFSALVSSERKVKMIYPGTYDRLVGTSVSSLIPEEEMTSAHLSDSELLQMPSVWSQTIPSGWDLVWPYRTVNGTEYLLIHIDSKKLCDDAAQRVDVTTNMFSVTLDQNGSVIWCSDDDELMSVPPEDVLTEFPTFRDVKDLVLYSWTGTTVYDVWNRNGLVRTGAWSSIQMYEGIWKVFVAI